MPDQAASVREALGRIKPGDKVVIGGACGVPTALLEGLLADSERLEGVTLYSGFLSGVDSYRFLGDPHGGRFRYVGWHMPHAFLKGIAPDRAEFLPITWGRIDRFLRELQPDVALIQVSPRLGSHHSLGVSVGYNQSLVRHAKTVIAEVNDQMPWTFGNSFVPEAEIDCVVNCSHRLEQFGQSARMDAVSVRVGEYVAEVIPEGAVLQIGVGTIPSATLQGLASRGKRVTLFSLITDDAMSLAEAGGLRPLKGYGPSVIAGETMGSTALFQWVGQNPAVRMEPSTRIQNTLEISTYDRFVAVNSTLEIDLFGQCNSEMLNGQQISGIGGSIDFIEGTWLSEGGMNIVALPSTTRDGRSRIVGQLGPGIPVTLPRYAVHTVVTEYGVARLFGKSDRERREGLIAVAHPDFRAELRRTVGG